MGMGFIGCLGQAFGATGLRWTGPFIGGTAVGVCTPILCGCTDGEENVRAPNGLSWSLALINSEDFDIASPVAGGETAMVLTSHACDGGTTSETLTSPDPSYTEERFDMAAILLPEFPLPLQLVDAESTSDEVENCCILTYELVPNAADGEGAAHGFDSENVRVLENPFDSVALPAQSLCDFGDACFVNMLVPAHEFQRFPIAMWVRLVIHFCRQASDDSWEVSALLTFKANWLSGYSIFFGSGWEPSVYPDNYGEGAIVIDFTMSYFNTFLSSVTADEVFEAWRAQVAAGTGYTSATVAPTTDPYQDEPGSPGAPVSILNGGSIGSTGYYTSTETCDSCEGDSFECAWTRTNIVGEPGLVHKWYYALSDNSLVV